MMGAKEEDDETTGMVREKREFCFFVFTEYVEFDHACH